MNLVLNAIEAMKDTAGELTIKSRQTADGQVLVSVSASRNSPRTDPRTQCLFLSQLYADRLFYASFAMAILGTILKEIEKS